MGREPEKAGRAIRLGCSSDPYEGEREGNKEERKEGRAEEREEGREGGGRLQGSSKNISARPRGNLESKLP